MDLLKILDELMVADTDTIQKATKDLEQALTLPETFNGLLNVMTGHVNPSHRQFSAMILKKNLNKFRDYKKLSLDTRQEIKNLIVTAVFNEKDNIVRAGMIQFLSVVLRHESQSDDAWVNEMLQYIITQCGSNDTQSAENGSFVFSKLADISPNLFVDRFSVVKGLFGVILPAVEGSSTNISPNVIVNVLTAMSALVPVILGNNEAVQMYEAAVPHIVNATNKFASEGLIAHFTAGLDILQNMAIYTPLLLNQHVRLLMEFALAVSSNISHDTEIRIKALNFVCEIVGEKKKIVMKLKLIEPILNVVFNIMASEPESDDADEFFEQGEIETPLSTATLVIDKMATKLPPEKFISPLLAILEPALKNASDNLRRRSAFIILATIAEGCKEAICDKYLEPMLNILKQGLDDPVPSVRNAALFAVGQFSEQLQPEINEYANDVLPLLFRHMQDILQAHQMGQQIDTKCVERVFYALEAFCDSMEDTLAPYLENLMCMILTLLSYNYPERFQILAMCLIESAANAFKGSILPWFEQLIEKLRPLLMQGNQNDKSELRSQAIGTLAAIARNIDKQFVPFAADTMQQSVVWIESTDDIDVRKSVINLFGALASVLGDDLAPVLPKILNHINRCIVENNDAVPALESVTLKEESDDEGEIDLESESNVSSDTQFYGDNPYSEAKIQAVTTIQELAESCMKILLPFAQEIFETLYKMIDHESDDLRKCSIEAAKTFSIKWNKESPSDAIAKQALNILIPKLQGIVLKDELANVVLEAQEAICDILSSLESNALPTKESRDSIVLCVKKGLTYEYACLFAGDNSSDDSQDGEDSESDQYVIEGAANLLAALGKAVQPEEFAEYFKFLEPYVMKHMDNVNEGNVQIERGHLIGVLAECYAPLGKNVGPYFVKHYKIMIRSSKRRNAKTRQNAIFGLGELMRAANELSYSYFPEALQILSEVIANEKKRIVVDNILGALARLILTNATQVPLQQVIPVMLQKLPIVDDEIENYVVMECFFLLYREIPETMRTYTGAIVTICIQTIAKATSEESGKLLVKPVVNLMQAIRSIYPNEYQQAIANPELISILPIAQEKSAGQL